MIIDLTRPAAFNRNDPFFMRVKIKHKPHWVARWLVRFLGLPFRNMPEDFVGWADDTVSMGAHAITHIEAPWHYGPVSGGARAQTVDEMPLEACIGPGVTLDMSRKQDGEPISVADIEAELARTGAVIAPGTITLIRTGRDQYLGQKDYWKRGTGVSAEATEWLIDRGSVVTGIDQWGWDLPFHHQIRRSKAEGRSDVFWEAHRVGQRKPYWHMEQLVNLAALPPHGFTVYVFPLKLVGASAAPARVIAIMD